ncbi:hypothetical protein HN51_055327 [Arachis hypogaea]
MEKTTKWWLLAATTPAATFMALETPATNGKPKPEAEQNNPSPVTSSICNGGNPNVGGETEGWLCVTFTKLQRENDKQLRREAMISTAFGLLVPHVLNPRIHSYKLGAIPLGRVDLRMMQQR